MLYKEFSLLIQKKDSNRNNKKQLYFFSYLFSKRIAYLFFKIGISADQATLLFGIVGLMSSFFYFYNYPLTAYFLWRLHHILDLVDGDIARATKYNPFAKITDKFQHIVINLTLYSSLFLSRDTFISDQSNIKIFIIMLPLLVIFFAFDLFISSIGLKSNFKYNKKIVLFKNLITFEGLVFFSTLILLLKNMGIIYDYTIFSYLLIFYNFSFLGGLLTKISIFKKNTNQNLI